MGIGRKTGFRMDLRTLAVLGLFFIGYSFLTFYFLNIQIGSLQEFRKSELRRLVYTGYNTVSGFITDYQEGRISRETALEEVTGTVRGMIFEDQGGKNYLFMSSYGGRMMVQPYEPEKEGTDQWDLQDPHGVYIIRELVRAATGPGGEGFVRYGYTNPTTGRTGQKLSFVKGIPALECYIGVGLYMDDINRHNNRYLRNSIILTVFIFSLLIFLFFLFFRPVLLSNELLTGYFRQIEKSPENFPQINLTGLKVGTYQWKVISGFRSMIERAEEYRGRIREDEEKFRSFFENSNDALFFITHGGAVREINSTARLLFGLETEEPESLSLGKLFPEEADFSSLLQELSGRELLRHREVRMRRLSGENLDVEITGLVPKLETGSERLYFLIVRDLSEQKELERQLLHSQKMESIGTLARGIAHDFNNYLGAIVGTVSLMRYEMEQNGSPDPRQFDRQAEIIEESCRNAAEMVSRLQEVSDQTADTRKVRNLSEILGRVAEICRNTFDKSVRIRLSSDGAEAPVSGDGRIEQVLLNICINAAHAMTIMRPPETAWGGELSLSLRRVYLHRDPVLPGGYPELNGYELVIIRDTGVGIPPEMLNRIFDPYFTTKRKGEGSGFGLAVAYKTVKEHGGFIEVESEPGTGTEFRIYWPSADSAQLSDRNSLPSRRSFSGEVLLIDDDIMIRRMAGKMLENLGLTVHTAASGEEGLKLLEKIGDRLRLVLLDVSMPGMTGTEVFPVIRDRYPEIRILLSSGYGDDPRIGELLTGGPHGFLQKPYTLGRLSDVLEGILDV